MPDTGRSTGLDHHDCVSESALSRDCLDIDIGLVSATEPDRAVLRDVYGRSAIAKLPARSGMETVPLGVEREERKVLGSEEVAVLR